MRWKSIKNSKSRREKEKFEKNIEKMSRVDYKPNCSFFIFIGN